MICGYIIKCQGRVIGFTVEPSTKLLQTKFGTANFPDDFSVIDFIVNEHYTSPLGLIFILDQIAFLDK